MGVLRLLLAVGVASEHAGYALWVGSYTAVQAFFIISGFYMSLIYVPRYGRAAPFYKSRLMRLVPAYLVMLLLAVLYYTIAALLGSDSPLPRIVQAFDDLGAFYAAWTMIANLFIVTSDWAWFLPAPEGVAHPLNLLLIPPIWTVSLELFFYLLCPLLLRLRTPWLAAVMVACVAGRAWMYGAGFDAPPYHARFFPFELVFFLAGVMAHRAHDALGERLRTWRAAAVPALLALFAATLLFNPVSAALALPPVYGVASYIPSLLFYVLLAACLPFLFDLTKASRMDQYIGEYSYPVYICHYVFVILFFHTNMVVGLSSVAVVVGLSFLHAAVLHHVIQVPVDRYRRGRASGLLRPDAIDTAEAVPVREG